MPVLDPKKPIEENLKQVEDEFFRCIFEFLEKEGLEMKNGIVIDKTTGLPASDIQQGEPIDIDTEIRRLYEFILLLPPNC